MIKKTYVSRFLLAELFKVDTRTLYRWKGLQEYRNNKGEYELKGAFDWWNRNINNGGGSEDTRNSRREYWKYRADGEELKLEKLKEKYVVKEKAVKDFKERAKTLSEGLGLLSLFLTVKTSGGDGDDIRNTLRVEGDNWLRKITDTQCMNPYSKTEALEIINSYRELLANGVGDC